MRDLPFDANGEVTDFRLLMPVENSGNVASFTFNANFQRNVPQRYVERPLETGVGYLLLVRMIQSVKEALHHSADLDSVKLVAEIRNVSRVGPNGKAL